MVIPGQLLGALEEFEPGTGAFEEGGQVYASVIGSPVPAQHQMQVENSRRVEKLRVGDLVYAQIKDLYEQVALLEFQPVSRKAASSTYAYLRISEVQKKYTENFRDAIRIGDYILAEVIEIKPLGIYLSMAAPKLGVVKAFCSACRCTLHKSICSGCGKTEVRKLALE